METKQLWMENKTEMIEFQYFPLQSPSDSQTSRALNALCDTSNWTIFSVRLSIACFGAY